MDSLGDRVKGYERVSQFELTRRTPVIIRVDGRAFHTFTQACEKPFDSKLMIAMVFATQATLRHMAGGCVAYTQSDEATFFLSDYGRLETQPWFGNNVNKLVSIAASMFTMYFNNMYSVGGRCAMFDARAFNVPKEEVANVFLWRQKDWLRNSIQMYARSFFTHNELMNKKNADIHEMLYEKGVNWADLEPRIKNGTYVSRTDLRTDILPQYEIINAFVEEQVYAQTLTP